MLHATTLVPRNGQTLVVGIVARISGCQNQKELSLDDQIDHAKQVVADYYKGPVEYRTIATKGKGERLDRPELEEIQALLRTRELDLLVAEDLGRMVRGTEAHRLCGVAVDHATRVIAPNDCIDTSEESWEADAIAACRDHVGHNSHTSRRLKHKLMNRFMKFGGATPCEIYGYIKPPGAKTYDQWQKDPAATPIYTEWFRMLSETGNCSAVADWLNQQGIPLGKYCRRKTWDGPMVRRLTRNPLLKGIAGRGFKHTVKQHQTGRRVSVANPAGPHFKEYPHLVHVEPSVWQEVNVLLKENNKGLGRKPVNGSDPRLAVPRTSTRFPGQHARCWYCGRHYVWGGNGMTENLMCSGAREWKCWNSVGFSGVLAVGQLTKTITEELYRIDGFDAQFRALVEEAGRQGGADLGPRWEKLKRDEEMQVRHKENLLAAIAEYGPQPMIQEKLSALDATTKRLAREKRDLEDRASRTLQLPHSTTELRRLLEQKFQGLAQESPAFGELMRQLVPNFRVHLVRLCDGGHLLPRAQVKLSLAGVVPDAKYALGVEGLLTRDVTLDLFESPQRERIREDAVRLAAMGLEQREIALRISEKPTQTAVYRALALDRAMRELGQDTPYVAVHEAPQDYGKLRRHKNPKFKFQPLEGHQLLMP